MNRSTLRNAARIFLIMVTVPGAACTSSAQGTVEISGASYAAPGALPSPVVFGDGVISTGDDESHPAFAPDGKTMYFLKNTPTFSHWTIVVSHFDGGKWSTPEVASFSGQYSDADPFISADGMRMFFISTRPIDGKPKQDTDIWMVERVGTEWGVPQHLGPTVNSDANEWFPTETNDRTLYFGSERPGGKGRVDIWRAKFTTEGYAEAENLGDSVNSAASEFEPYVAPDGSYLIVSAAGRQDGKGLFDLFVSRSHGGVWSKLENLGEPINSGGWDFSPKVSPDGKYFFFTSSRGSFDAPLEKALTYQELLDRLHRSGNGLRDIYQVDLDALHLKE